MADSKLSALSELSVPALDDELYIVDDPDGTPVSNAVKVRRLFGNAIPSIAEGRLTTEAGVPVSTSDRTSQGTIYYTPYIGKGLSLYDGTRWRLYAFSEISLALSSLTSGKNYDVFVYDNSGTLTLELSAAWTNDTTRADALTTQDGVYVKSGATTRRYLGTLRTTGTTTTEDSVTKRFVWNIANRVLQSMRAIDTTNSWTYTTNAWRQANGASANKVEYVCGLAEDHVTALVSASLNVQAGAYIYVAVGVDSTTAASGLPMVSYSASTSVDLPIYAEYRGIPGLGYHYLAWIENGGGSPAGTTIYGDNNETGKRQSGIQATIRG